MMKAVTLDKDDKQMCSYCNTYEQNILKLGGKFQIGEIVVHYFCVLLSKGTYQNGRDNDGLNGFLYDDIKKGIEKIKNVICVYCDKPGAATVCANFKCRASFHLTCGIEAGSLTIFKYDYKSYCAEHRRRQVVPVDALSQAQLETPTCVACLELVNIEDDINSLWAPCCEKNWYHRTCLLEMALNAGSLFKCAVCSNRSKFRMWMGRYGIYVPERDALWESVPGAFDVRPYARCDVVPCASPYGPEADRAGTMWEILVCSTCGSKGTHISCSNLKFITIDWQCPECDEITGGNKHEKLKRKRSYSPDGRYVRVKMDNFDSDSDDDLFTLVPKSESDDDSDVNVLSSDSNSDVNVVSTDSNSDVEVV